MNADVAIEVGNSHKLCEDYGRAALFPCANDVKLPYVIISDGCSDPKSPDTDFGARLLVKAAENFLLVDGNHFATNAIAAASAQAQGIGLHKNSLDCTLLVATSTLQGVAKVMCWGDGAIVARRRDGSMRVIEIQFPSGAPYYLNYELDRNRLSAFYEMEVPPDQKTGLPGMKGLMKLVKGYEIDAQGNTTLAETTSSGDPETFRDFKKEEYQFVGIMTDGVESFYSINDKGIHVPVPLTDVVKEVMRYGPATGGEFVQRRFNKFSKEFCEKNGWYHYDDFTIGVINLGS
jgi:hypothetical protein